MPAMYVYALSEAQNHLCCYCHHPMLTEHTHRNGAVVPRNLLTKDHYEPRCYGGPTHKDNLIAACGQCNWIRGSLDAETFYVIIHHWFSKDETLRDRWHDISHAEYVYFKKECERIDRVQWQRRVKKCIGASILSALVPLPLPPHQLQA